MTSGGARTTSGPPPDENALRRDRPSDAATWTTLPAEGRAGHPPAWPLTEAMPREAELWTRLWATPQAMMWERLQQTLEVALYVRRLGEAELPGASAATATLVRQMADALGLTIPGLRVNRWRIGFDQVAAKRAEHAAPAAAPGRAPSARDRFRAVDGPAG